MLFCEHRKSLQDGLQKICHLITSPRVLRCFYFDPGFLIIKSVTNLLRQFRSCASGFHIAFVDADPLLKTHI